jgi:hypothetical protein
MKPIRKLLSVIACGLFSYSATSAATTVSDSAPAQTDILATHISSNYPSGPGGSTDSFPTFNRAMWWFNYDIMDKNVLRPVVHGYVKWVPTPFRTGVSNFVDNLEEPNNIVNNMLLGEVKHSGASLARFSLNSTVGMLGAYIAAGPQFDFNIGNKTWTRELSLKKSTTSFNVGAGLKLIRHLQLGVNYNFALSKTGTYEYYTEGGSGDGHHSVNIKNNTWQVSLAYLF